jgi:tetratricopeptide (TPR) repeat protein
MALVPDELRALARLSALYERQGRYELAVHSLEQLIDMTPHEKTREQYIVRRANLLVELGQQHLAEQSLDAARRAAPASMPVLRALCRLYEQQADRAALTLHLQRSCHALRAAIELEPGEVTHWLGLCELLLARQRPEGLQLVAGMARALGFEHPDLQADTLQGMGREALRDVVMRRVAVRGALDPLRALLQQHAAAIAPNLPFSGPAHASSLEHAPHVLYAVEQLFGVRGIALVASNQAICVPVTDEPLRVCVGRALYLQASDAERFFLVTRAVAVAKLGCTLLVRSVPERMLLVLHALWTVAEPAHSAVVLDAHEQLRVTRDLAAAIPAAARPHLAELVAELMSQEDLNPRRLAAHAFDHGSRVALLVTGNVSAALHALLRLRGKPPAEFQRQEVLELCRTDPAIRALLSFAISEVYLEARRALSPLFEQETD